MGKASEKKVKKNGAEDPPLEPTAKKQVLFMLSSSYNAETKQLLKDLYNLFKISGVYRSNYHNDVEQEENLKLQINKQNHSIAGFVSNRMGCGLYVVASSNKKRPMSLGFGRLYDGKILDCLQTKVVNFVPFNFFKGPNDLEISHYSYPLVIAQGADFGHESGKMRTVRDILLDVFRPPATGRVSLDSIQQVIILTSVDKEKDSSDEGQRIMFRRYQIILNKSKDDPKLPKVELKEIGPRFDLELLDSMEADPEVFKHATAVERKPRKLAIGESVDGPTNVKRRKNVKTTALGHTEGRVFLGHQSLDKLYTPHTKTLKAMKHT
ncbi:ribosome biogenesis protein Rpf2 like protein [Babesia gibsoni]|uniref:Ribosome production factor 2 homolog n=1 Tax=Babesia gibsoni TaxID=33632 RepID=A0AAD8PDZ5_BABGI|nr:ribosome biogenesis protein Rpf2 like protein [Babesia gibsoni]